MVVCRYVFDLRIPSTYESGEVKYLFEPRPSDGEVDSFEVCFFI